MAQDLNPYPHNVADDPVAMSLWRLRGDAIESGFRDLAICLGWSLIRMGQDHLDAVSKRIIES